MIHSITPLASKKNNNDYDNDNDEFHLITSHTPLLLVEQFSQQRTPTSPRTPEMRKKRWQCSNPKCKTWCSGVSGRCTACLTNREERDHVVFLLHGFNVRCVFFFFYIIIII